MNFFMIILIHLLGLNYPENLSSIGLMVKAVDTFHSAGAVRCGAGAGAGARSDYTENLSQIRFGLLAWPWPGLGWAWLGLAWLWLRFVMKQ